MQSNSFNINSILIKVVIVFIILFSLCIDEINIKIVSGLFVVLFFTLLKNRLFSLFFLLLLLYTVSSYLFSIFGGVYFGLDEGTIITGTNYALNIYLVLSLLIIIIFSSSFSDNYYFDELYKIFVNVDKNKYLFICGVSVVIFLITIFELIKYGNFSSLRSNKDIFTFSENQYYQIFMLPFSLIILSKLIQSKNKSHILIFLMLMSPVVLSGSRKELFIIFCSFYLLNKDIVKGKRKIYIILFLLFMLLFPLFREGSGVYDSFASFHEFILPQYSFYLILEHSYYIDKFGNSDVFRGFWSLLPGFLRLSDYYTIGNTFSSFGFVNIGLASNPSLEAYINFGDFGCLFYPIIITMYISICYYIFKNKIYWMSPFIFYLLLLGRSDIWLMIFFSLYTSFILFFLLKRFSYDIR